METRMVTLGGIAGFGSAAAANSLAASLGTFSTLLEVIWSRC
jgi:hypothetical protein